MYLYKTCLEAFPSTVDLPLPTSSENFSIFSSTLLVLSLLICFKPYQTSIFDPLVCDADYGTIIVFCPLDSYSMKFLQATPFGTMAQ